jgi:hypothetical protein
VALSRFDFTPVTDERPRVDILIGDPKASIAKIAELVETSVHRHLGDSVSERLVAVGLTLPGPIARGSTAIAVAQAAGKVGSPPRPP